MRGCGDAGSEWFFYIDSGDSLSGCDEGFCDDADKVMLEWEG